MQSERVISPVQARTRIEGIERIRAIVGRPGWPGMRTETEPLHETLIGGSLGSSGKSEAKAVRGGADECIEGLR
ncbi:MAG TPA: hypothetical protein VK419_02240, partial [Bryobacteraceae bacterium]|nr:hypothetical protein [Bryobacteraceae bacterium]